MQTSSRQYWAPTPGPVDRTSFFDEQRRNRRATWRMAAACGLALIAVGVPLSLVLSPLLYAVALIVLNSINLFVPIPAALAPLQSAGELAFSVLEYLSDESGANIPLAQLALGVAVWFVPGVLAVAIIWLGIYFLFRHAGIGSIVLTLGARPPQVEDLEEQQLGNVIEEMSLAAGISPPRLMLVDTPIINAAAVGSSSEDATVIVSRHLLDALDREQTQGVIGHLVGSIGNGDLRIAFLMTSVLLTFGSLVAILGAPFGPQGRAAFLQLLRLGLKGWRRKLDGEAERELLKTLITDGLQIVEVNEKKVSLLLMPFMLANLSVQLTLFILVPGLLSPLLALLWRTRRYLADATTVQLTRNPNGIARALRAGRWGLIPGSQGVSHLFVIGPVGAETFAEFLEWQGIGFHPPLKHRLNRLRALGARVEMGMTNAQQSGSWTSLSLHHPVLAYVLRGVIAILLPVAGVTCVAAMVLFVGISMFAMGIFLIAIHGVFMGLGALKGWILG